MLRPEMNLPERSEFSSQALLLIRFQILYFSQIPEWNKDPASRISVPFYPGNSEYFPVFLNSSSFRQIRIFFLQFPLRTDNIFSVREGVIGVCTWQVNILTVSAVWLVLNNETHVWRYIVVHDFYGFLKLKYGLYKQCLSFFIADYRGGKSMNDFLENKDVLLSKFHSDPDKGLSSSDVIKNAEEYGRNTF